MNKPLKEKQRIKLRDMSLVLVAAMTILSIIFACVRVPYTEQLAYYVSGGTSAAISLIVARIQNRAVEESI